MQSVRPHNLTKEEDIAGVLEQSPQPPMHFCGFYMKKKLVSAHFLIKKGHIDTSSECTHYYSLKAEAGLK